jgi:predicted nucleic acid-binding protein
MIVADTNLVAYTVIPGAATRDAERVRKRDHDWTAPSLLRFELMNVIAKECKGNRLSRDGALRTMRRGMNLVKVSKLVSDPLFIFNTCLATGCSTYDLEFVWLAMELAIPLVTADQQILRAFPTVAVDVATFA